MTRNSEEGEERSCSDLTELNYSLLVEEGMDLDSYDFDVAFSDDAA